MAEQHGQRVAPPVLLDHVQIGVADARRLDPDEHLARPRLVDDDLLERDAARLAENYAASQPRPIELPDRRGSHQRQRQIRLGHQVLDGLLDAAPAADGERIGVEAPDQHGVGSERHRLYDVRGTANAAVHQDDCVGKRVANLDQRIE